MNNLLKSIGAVLTGFITIFILAVALDHFLEKAGLMQTETFNFNSGWVIAVVVIGRLLFNIAGPYITARLAPNRPLRHALILGMIGVVVNTMGGIMMWPKTPHWFPLILILLPLPCAWIAAKLVKPKSTL